MNFIKEYFKVIGYMILGLVFIFSSFYLLANAYHYLEIRKDYVVAFDQLPAVQEITKNLDQVQKNIDTFDPNTYSGTISVTNMNLIRENFKNCIEFFNNKTYTSMHNKQKLTIIDAYKLSDAYDDQVLDKCINTNLNWVISDKNDYITGYLIESKEMNKMYVRSLINATSYVKKDLLNNSSYYYNTNITSSSVKDNTRDSIDEILSAYNKASKYLLYISEWYRKEVGA